MKSWRIHFGWAIVTALATVISARIASRHAAVDGPSHGSSSLGAVQNPSATDPEPRKMPAAPIGKGGPVPTSDDPLADTSLAARIRDLLKNSEHWEELEKLLASGVDRSFSLQVLKEELFGKDLQSCYAAIHFLVQMKGRDAAEILESYLKTNGDKDQAPNVAAALGEVRDPGSMPVLIDALQSKNPQLRLWSAEALFEMGYSAPAEEFIAAMARQYQSPDGGVRKKAVDSVSQFSLDSVVPILSLALKDSNSDVRISGLTGFFNLRKPEYIPLLEPLLHDPVPEVAEQTKLFIEALRNP